MAATPNEYYIRYRLTDKDNTGTTGQTPWLAKSRFALSGNTDIAIGKITRIVYYHYHTSTKTPTWNLRGELSFADGSVIYSDVKGHQFSADVYRYVNTFTEDLPSPEKFSTWASIRSKATNSPSSGKLYYRATSKYPLDIYVYFYDARDLVDGASPPTVNGIQCTDANGLMASFGQYVQEKSNAVINGVYQLDPKYIYLEAQHTLQLISAGGTTLYNATQKEDARFMVGALHAAGEISWVYTVLDTAGNSVTKTGSFNVLPYAPPSISGLTVERYSESTDDMGATTYPASEDGDRVRFTFMGSITPVANRNAWQLQLTYGSEDTSEDGGTTVTVQSGSDGCNLIYTEDRAILDAMISTSDAWWFKIQITDSFNSASMIAYVDEAGAFFDVEEDGVAVGMRSRADETDKCFEVADSYEARFHGGIRGLTNYVLHEVLTGGRWIDGRPIYRRMFAGDTTLSNAQGKFAEFPEIPDMIFRLEGIVGSDAAWRPIPNNYYGSSTWNCNIYVTGKDIYLGFGSSWKGSRHVVLITEYTKSTDAIRTIWVYSAKGGAVILAEQSEELFDFTDDGAGNVTITAMADLPISATADGYIIIG